MTQTKNEVKKSAKKPDTRFGKHRSPAAMTTHKRAGHSRHASASPPAAGTTSGIANSEFGTSTASTGGDGKDKKRESGRRGREAQQRHTREFMSGASEHPQASNLDRPINVSPTAGTPYFMTKSNLGTGVGQQHARA